MTKRIEGSDSVPVFAFSTVSANRIDGGLINNSDLPVLNLTIQTINYDEFLTCRQTTIGVRRVIEKSCFDNCSNPLVFEDYISPHSMVKFSLPGFKGIENKGRYVVNLLLKGKIFEEQILYGHKDKLYYIAVRIVEYRNNKAVSNKVRTNTAPYHIDWDKEFPIQNLASIRDIQF